VTDTEDRPSVQETYQRATQSSNLKPTRCGVRGDLDVVGAAAFVPESLGMLLFRLVGEYDRARGEKALYEAEAARLYDAQRQAAKVLDALRQAGKKDTEAFDKAQALHKSLGDEARREIVTGRAMVLLQLTSLASAKQWIGELAVSLASAYPVPFDITDLMHLTGRVLDVFLDPTCPPCEGRGFNGGAHRGERQMICRVCHGSGHRRDDVGHTPEERHLASRMLIELSRRMTDAEKCLRAALRDEA
jgi:hypothetical protein